jgi:alcohol dehydrogenase class IV
MDRRAARKATTVIELPPNVHRLEDVRAGLAPIVAAWGGQAVIVTDPVIAAAGVSEAVESSLGCETLMVPGGEPVMSTVADLASTLADRGCDVVVAVGGGSVLDTVKLAARLVKDPSGLESRLLSARPFPQGAAVVALPTTSGAGAEVTRTAIVSHSGRKTWAWDERLRPEAAVLAPELTATTPRSVAIAAGLDAFVHAVEAGTGQRRTPEITALAAGAAAEILMSLPVATDERSSVSARKAMMGASAAAGVAIDHCGTGIGHAVGHALASIGPVPHGLAVMAGLRAGLEWTLSDSGDAYQLLAERLVSSGEPMGLPAVFAELCGAVDFDTELGRWPCPDPGELAREMACDDHRPMRENNARPISLSDLEEISRMVTARWPR